VPKQEKNASQRGPERPREAQRDREAQRGPERPREAQRRRESLREVAVPELNTYSVT